MAYVNEVRVFHETKEPYVLPNDALEWERLDELHNGISVYLDHKLSLCSAVRNVKRILEIGCGSGAWAIQAAQTYPEATVVAIDISPIPPRPLNLQFLQLNVTEPLPFELESFDIIHARLVFVHLRNWETVLKHITSYLKPQGWLWIEDIDIQYFDDAPSGLGRFQKMVNHFYTEYMLSINVYTLAGSSLNSVLQKAGCFSEVNCVTIKCPLNGKDKDPSIQRMGHVWYSTLRRTAEGPNPKLIAAGLTTEMIEGALREARDPLGSSYWKFYMTWSQKK